MSNNTLIHAMLEKMCSRCGGDTFVLKFVNSLYADPAFALAYILCRTPTDNPRIYHGCYPKAFFPKSLQRWPHPLDFRSYELVVFKPTFFKQICIDWAELNACQSWIGD